MTLKAVEMQIAIPRTQEAGRIQEQLSGRSAHDQFLLASEQQRRDQRSKQRSENVGKSEMSTNRDGNRQPGTSGQNGQNRAETEEKPQSLHPYKGKVIDIIL